MLLFPVKVTHLFNRWYPQTLADFVFCFSQYVKLESELSVSLSVGSLHGPLCLSQSVCYCFFFPPCLSLPALPPSLHLAATAAHRYYCNLLKTVLFHHRSSFNVIWRGGRHLKSTSCVWALTIDLNSACQCVEVLWNKTVLQRNVALMSLWTCSIYVPIAVSLAKWFHCNNVS